MSKKLKEYVVSTSEIADTYLLYNDLVSSKKTPKTIPNRSVELLNSMESNQTSTAYLLTDKEAENLLKDPRVVEVINPEEFSIIKFAFQDGSFNKTTTQNGEVQNWGLLRHVRETNIFGTNTADPGGTYDYVLDGTGVDVVIVDSGIQANHPEFQDANGVSRVKQINWYVEAGISGTMPAGFYEDYDGHGTHVAATIAGKTFGWAKNSDIYSMKLSGLEGSTDPNSGIATNTALQLILEWHKNKISGRPTVLNNSWGTVWFFNTNNDTGSLNDSDYFSFSNHIYRGEPPFYAGGIVTRNTSTGLIGQQVDTNKYVFGRRISFIDSWISSMISFGIIVCNAAGNDSQKIDISGGIDYDNSLVLNSTTLYYHRGSSPNSDGLDGMEVGSIGVNFVSGVESKSPYSTTGPGVEIYAAGDRIISAMSNVNVDISNVQYYLNSSFKQQKLTGTSMACPQIAGICALLLQAHSDWSPYQVKYWVINNSKSVMYTTNLDDDYTNVASVLSGERRVAYFPMSGQKVFEFLGS